MRILRTNDASVPFMRRARSWAVDWSSGSLNWINKAVCYPDLDAPIGWRDHLRWWLESIVERIFAWAYPGSLQEESQAFDFIDLDVADIYLTDRQIEIKRRLAEFADLEHEN